MLNPFPIQFLALFAYTILRVCVGVILVCLGFSHIRDRHSLKESFSFRFFPYGLFSIWYMAVVELIIGTMFILGLYTQIAALISIILAIKCFIFNRRFVSPTIPGRLFYILLFAVSFSLFITGAGFFAFDLPI